MSTSERDQMRKVFFESWRKHQLKLPLETLEAQLVDIILLHPELQPMFNQPENFQSQDFGESNPFLHLGLHMALREQIATNRPQGIKKIYAELCAKCNDVHTAEHRMMDCLAEVLWQTQVNNKMTDEQSYLEMLVRL